MSAEPGNGAERIADSILKARELLLLAHSEEELSEGIALRKKIFAGAAAKHGTKDDVATLKILIGDLQRLGLSRQAVSMETGWLLVTFGELMEREQSVEIPMVSLDLALAAAGLAADTGANCSAELKDDIEMCRFAAKRSLLAVMKEHGDPRPQAQAIIKFLELEVKRG